MILARDEVIINEWEYATSIRKNIETKHSLVVTNKRIVSSVESSRRLTQREIPLSSVQNVTMTHETPSFAKAICSIVFGVIFAILAIVSFVLAFSVYAERLVPIIVCLSLGVVLLILSIVLLALGIKGLNQGAFTLEFSSNTFPEYGLMSIGFDKIFDKKRNLGRVVLYIDNAIAKEIIDSIGSIIIDNR